MMDHRMPPDSIYLTKPRSVSDYAFMEKDDGIALAQHWASRPVVCWFAAFADPGIEALSQET